MHAPLGIIATLLLALTIISSIHANPLNLNPVPEQDNLHVQSPPASPEIPTDGSCHPQTASLGIYYSYCYVIKDKNANTLGSDGGVYSYYKFGSSRRAFQVWYSRAFTTAAGSPDAVPSGGTFFLWDPAGSTQTNGGSWVATNLGGYTYPGFGGYWYYLRFRGRASDRGSGVRGARHGYPVTLSIAKVEPPGGLAGYQGLKVQNDYIWNQNNEDTIDVEFYEVECPYADNKS